MHFSGQKLNRLPLRRQTAYVKSDYEISLRPMLVADGYWCLFTYMAIYRSSIGILLFEQHNSVLRMYHYFEGILISWITYDSKLQEYMHHTTCLHYELVLTPINSLFSSIAQAGSFEEKSLNILDEHIIIRNSESFTLNNYSEY